MGLSHLPSKASYQPARMAPTTISQPRSYTALAAWIARHTRSGVAGISIWRTPNSASASTSAFATAGIAPTQPASPAPLTPSGLVLVGTGLALTSTAREVVGARHGVVHERAGDELAVAVEVDVLLQDLADALRDAADDLALEQQRIDHGADVVDHAVFHDLDLAGLRIDLDLADVHAVREVLDVGACRPRWRTGRPPCPSAAWPGSQRPAPRP